MTILELAVCLSKVQSVCECLCVSSSAGLRHWFCFIKKAMQIRLAQHVVTFSLIMLPNDRDSKIMQ